MLEAGTPAPDFAVPDQDGTVVTLESLRGHWVAMWWYPMASTPGCTVQGGGFRDRTPEFEEAGAVVLGVSFDTVEAQKHFADDQGFPYRLLADTDRTMGMAYDADPSDNGFARRTTYLIDPEGTIVRTYDLRGEDLEAHAGVVLDDIRALS